MISLRTVSVNNPININKYLNNKYFLNHVFSLNILIGLKLTEKKIQFCFNHFINSKLI